MQAKRLLKLAVTEVTNCDRHFHPLHLLLISVGKVRHPFSIAAEYQLRCASISTPYHAVVEMSKESFSYGTATQIDAPSKEVNPTNETVKFE
jgi:hypothetical protein